MIIEKRQAAPVTYYRSAVMPEVETTDALDGAEAIEWADANPVVWKILTTSKSKTYGKSSNFYCGGQKSKLSPDDVYFRLRCFKKECEKPESDFYGWRARFTLAHYNDKGFTGGFFQQWDEKYSRGCCDCDYTPETRDDVIDRFLAWCDGMYTGWKHATHAVSIDYVSVPFARYQDGAGVDRGAGVIPEIGLKSLGRSSKKAEAK